VPYPPGYLQNPNAFYTADQPSRRSADHGRTQDLQGTAQGWLIDGKAEYMEQRADWRLGGEGSPGLETFKAQMYQVG